MYKRLERCIGELRVNHTEEVKEILEQAKVMRRKRRTKVAADQERLKIDDMKILFKQNQEWMDKRAGGQCQKIMLAAEQGASIEEIAGMVWICSSRYTIEEIEDTMLEYLREKREKERTDRTARREELSQKIQKELERRTSVESKAMDLIAEGDHEGARKLLDNLDDGIIKSLQKEYLDLWEEDR